MIRKTRIIVTLGLLTLCNLALAVDDPLTHWKFDEGSGTIAYDSADSNDGVLVNGPAWTVGRVDGALSFDGVDDYVNCGNSWVLNPLDSISITAWIYPNVLTADNHQAIVMRELGPYQNYAFWVSSREGTGDNLEFNVGTGSDNIHYIARGAISAGKWQHVAVAMGDGQVSLYVDGVEKLNVDSNSAMWQGDAPFVIGGRIRDGYSDWFNGLIDDVRVYDRALSQDEIRVIIPEPATLFLLSLGGMTILRNRGK
jgi:hypothetical protein